MTLRLEATPAFYVGKTNASDMDQLHFILGETGQSDLQTAIDIAKR